VIDNDPFETATLAKCGRGEQLGSGLLFVVLQILNLENGEIVLEGRPLRENHQYRVSMVPGGQRVVTYDGLTVILSREALDVYHRNYLSNQKLGHTVITAVVLLDANQYRHFLITGNMPTHKES
jgi:hypothetical protein